MSDHKLAADLQAALIVSTPLVSITTADAGALIEMLVPKIEMNEFAEEPRPILGWDIMEGFRALNEAGKEVMKGLESQQQKARLEAHGMLEIARELQEDCVVIAHNLHMFFKFQRTVQGIYNLRDRFKRNGRMFIMLHPLGTQLPVEIRQDVMCFNDPLPTEKELRQIVDVALDAVQATHDLDGEKIDLTKCRAEAAQAAVALLGTNSFQAEQLAAISIAEEGFRHSFLADQARELIEQTPGLHFERGKETFDDIAGMDGARQWGADIFSGPAAPAVVVRIEELEKSMAGASGDMSGTSQDALQVLLSELEDNDWDGILAFGAPGSGKSLLCKSLANSYEAKALRFDLNACKGSLVGQSEQQIRQAIQVIKTLGDCRVLFVASCNRLDSIPAELQRRFRSGIWMFDCPTTAQRRQIWDLHHAKYFDGAKAESYPDQADLMGSDIRNIIDQAWRRQTSLEQAARGVVPLKQRSPEVIQAAREMAHNRFWDVNTGLVYQNPNHQTTTAEEAADTRRRSRVSKKASSKRAERN